MRWIWTLLLVLAFSLPALAADGTKISQTRSTQQWDVTRWFLCDSHSSADTCAELRVDDPCDWYIFATQTKTGCSTYTLTVRTSTTAGAADLPLCTISDTAGSSEFCAVKGPLLERFDANITTATGCTDLDVIVECLSRRAP